MFCYQHSKTSQCVTCTPALFDQAMGGDDTARRVDEVRRLKACGQAREAGNVKRGLPAFMFQVREVMESVGDKPYNKGQTGRWRLQSQCVLNGLAVCDFDHLADDPRTVFARWADPVAEGICLVFVSPGGEGLKVVFRARMEWGSLVENQQRMAALLGLEAVIDESCKDASRLCFASKAEDILLIDRATLFGYEDPAYDERFGPQYREGLPSSPALPPGPPMNSGGEYRGVAYGRIVEKWIELHGRPGEGDRHQTMVDLAKEVRRICENDPSQVLALLRACSVGREILRVRAEGGAELARIASDACGYAPHGRMPVLLGRALSALGIRADGPQGEGMLLPYDEWWQRLRRQRLGCYGCAVEHIDNPLVKAGGVITASAMYAALMTRCDYQDWRGEMHRLNPMVLVVGPPTSGKSFAVIQDEHIMKVLRESDEQGRIAETDYKEECHLRETSVKEQKKEGLTRPKDIIRYQPVKTSNAVLYRRFQNAVETGYNGEPWPLHIYMFASELMSFTNAKGGFQEKRDLLLQAFNAERNGVDYAHAESVNGTMPVLFIPVFTGTRTSLGQFINPRNIGDGLSTRFSSWLMPGHDFSTAPYRRQRRDGTAYGEMERWGRFFDALRGEVRGLERLVKHVYDRCAAIAEEAEADGDCVRNMLRMRLQDKLMNVCIPQVISTQKDLDAVGRTLTVKVERHHLVFADLMCDVLLGCEEALFGQQLQDMFDNEARDAQLRRVYDKTAQHYARLPDEFTTQDVMRVFGYSRTDTASKKTAEWVERRLVGKVRRGLFRKLAAAI